MLTFDLETTNLDYGSALNEDNRVVAVCWQVDNGPIRKHYGNISASPAFVKAFQNADIVCAYNAKFEMLWMKRVGFDIDKKIWHDPMLAQRVLDGNKHERVALAEVAPKYGSMSKDSMIDSLMKSGVCPSDMPRDRLLARCARDVRTTREILDKQLAILTEREQLHLYRCRADFCVVLAHIESEGMLLDGEKVYEQYTEYSRVAAETKAKLDECTGGINLRSPDQVAHFLYGTLKFPEKKNVNGKPLRNKPSKQFPKGRPRTDKNTMKWLEAQAKTERQKTFVELRQEYGKANAALVKNLEFFKGVVDERDCRFFAQFNQTVAATHRLTSSGKPLQFKQFPKPKSVQFQNMPRAFKGLFTAEDGYVIAEVDGSQLEFRVAAYCGQDKQALADIADPDFDAHCTSAAVMNDIPYETFLRGYRGETTKTAEKSCKRLRTEAKADTFKPLFGGTRGTEKQERWYREFQKRYAGVYAQQENWVAEVAREGCLKLPWGMRFYYSTEYSRGGMLLDKITKRPLGPQIFNHPIQELATAEIVPIAIISLYKRCKAAKIDVKFINTVHDSVICMVKDDVVTLKRFKKEAEQAFTTDVYEYLAMFYGIDFNVPLGCGITIGKHWGEGKEHSYDDVRNFQKKEQAA